MTREIHYDLSRRPVLPSKAIYVYDATGGINISAGATDITYDTEVYKDSGWFTFTATSAVITILKAGVYRVSYSLGTDNTDATNRAVSQANLYKNTGGGYAVIGGTAVYMYNRNSANGRASASISILHSFGANDLVKVQGQQQSGSGVAITLADTCGLLIEAFLPT